MLIFTVGYLRSSRCSDRKQAAANTGIVSSFQRGLCNLSLLLQEGAVFLPTVVTAFQCGRGEKCLPEIRIWRFRGFPPSAALKGTQIFQCNLIYKFILFLKERTEISGIRTWVNSSEPHSRSCQNRPVPLSYMVWQEQANTNCISLQFWTSITKRRERQRKRKTLKATATVWTIHYLLQALIACCASEARIRRDRLRWLNSGQFNFFGCRERGLGFGLFSLPGFKACHSIKHQAVPCTGGQSHPDPTATVTTTWGLTSCRQLGMGDSVHLTVGRPFPSAQGEKHWDQRIYCMC